MENRVRDYYETACAYLSLPITARFIIGTHFKILSDHHLQSQNENSMDDMVFKEVGARKIYSEFKSFVSNYKKSESYEYYL